MADYAHELRKLADTLDEAKRELNLAREQSTRPKHLKIRARRAAVQAARVVASAVDLGFSEIWPHGWWFLSAMRNPDDPDRPPATIQVGEWKAEIRSMKLGSGCNPDGTLRDDTAFAVWIQQICPVLRSRQTTAKADAGAFDIPKVKTEAQGRPLGRDGKPLQLVEKTDPETGKPAGSYLQFTEARVTDDYDEADTLEHLRCQAADWVDACDVAADLIRKEAMEAEARLTSGSDVNAIIEPDGTVECHVTLTQMAAMVNRTKRTLERLRDVRKLPAPAVKGGKGKADEWRWSDVRPILQDEYDRQLPKVFPADRFVGR